MTLENNVPTQPNRSVSFLTPVLVGAGIALLVILFFVLGADAPNAWGEYWMVRPLIITPLAGATGGAFYAFMDHQSSYRGFNRILAILLSTVVYLIGLWLGIVLGLDGTMWD